MKVSGPPHCCFRPTNGPKEWKYSSKYLILCSVEEERSGLDQHDTD